MIRVHFNQPQDIIQHGEPQECLFLDCIELLQAEEGANWDCAFWAVFGENDKYIIYMNGINKIELI